MYYYIARSTHARQTVPSIQMLSAHARTYKRPRLVVCEDLLHEAWQKCAA